MTTRDRVTEALRTDEERVGESNGDDHAAAVLLVADASAGVRRFAVTVHAPEGTRVAAVEPGALRPGFDVAEGGVGSVSVTAQAVDFVGAGRDAPVVLLGVRFDGPVRPASVDTLVERLVDHEEADVAPDRVTVEPVRTE